MMILDPSTVTRAQAALEALRELVLSGDFPEGSRLNEVDLATRLGVSRTPIRAALTALATEDLVKYTPNSGYTIRSYSVRDLENHLEVRAVLEGLANRQAAELGLSDDLRVRLESKNNEIGELVERGVWSNDVCDRWVRLNRQFHLLICQASGNLRLGDLLEKSPAPYIHAIRYYWFDLDFVRRAHEEHLEMFDVISRRIVSRADALGREHIYRTTRPLLELWSRIQDVRTANEATGKHESILTILQNGFTQNQNVGDAI